MGNRAVITDAEKQIGIYLHWNGGRDTIEPLLAYCKLKGYRDVIDDPCYSLARLTQVIANFFGGGTSIGIGLFSELDTDNNDNGTYVIGKDFYGNMGSYPTKNYSGFDTKEQLLEKINTDFADNSLDAGFGFDRLLAARMHVCMKHTMMIDDKYYTHEEWQNVDIGDTILIDKLTKENGNE